MAYQSGAQKQAIGRAMHEFKHGELVRGHGGKVRNPRQAIAIALSEAGVSDRQSPATNRRRLADTKRADTKRKGRSGQAAPARRERPTRAALYQDAARKGIAGRSRMGKAGLRAALEGAQQASR